MTGPMNGMAFAWAIGVTAGALVAAPIASRAVRHEYRRRTRELAGPRSARARASNGRATPFHGAVRMMGHVSGGPVGRVARGLVARRRRAREGDRLRRELPLVADLLAVAVGAGCTPFLALRSTVRWAPAASAGHLSEVLRVCELGVAFDEALQRLGASVGALGGLADALVTSERTGAPVGAALARTADESRAAVRRATEARARTVPVRLLFPLVFLVLPAFGLLTVAPALLTAFART
jgi:tight adherence protein C